VVFETSFVTRLPMTAELLLRGSFVVHPAVERVVLHGSRGPTGGSREGSDIDLSLVVSLPPAGGPVPPRVLREAIDTSLAAWAGQVELDVAAVFDVRGCGLSCFEDVPWDPVSICGHPGIDCFGLFRTQKGFTGFVHNSGVRIALMRPCVTIWRR
jgi:hypothetical protein